MNDSLQAPRREDRTAGLRVLHVVAGLADGGIGVAVPCLCRSLAEQGVRVTLATVAGARDDAPGLPGVEVLAFRRSRPHAIHFSWQMLLRLGALVRAADVVHIHSNWTFPVWWAAATAARRRKPVVMSPHGCLLAERLRSSAGRKRLAGALFDRRLLRRAAQLHATSGLEEASFRGYGLTNPVVVVPLGAEEPPPGEATRGRGGRRNVLFLGRLHPLKGVANLVQAWAGIRARSPAAAAGWHVVIAGPDEQRQRRELEEAARGLGLTVGSAPPEQACEAAEDVVFTGPVAAAQRWRLYRAADLLALPSLSENFGLVVPEALACGLPVIATRATPWAELAGVGGAGRCGWWIDVGVAPLAQALQEAMALADKERAALGASGQRLATNYSWSRTARETAAAYRAVLAGRGRAGAADRSEVTGGVS